MMQISLFDGDSKFHFTKPIRLIELFAGIGSQAKAMENLGLDFEHYRVCEFDKYAIKSYNAIHETNFETSDITQIHAEDLNIVDTDKYDYVMTYSHPCQDLSVAGLQKGMQKGTRSGLLWEVERLLSECEELPQVLLMENVSQVINKKNMPLFAKWLEYLDKLGYKSFYQILNAKDYEIPQNRKRCFMVSIKGNYYYEFPKRKPLEHKLFDFLETDVDKKYYLSQKGIDYIKVRQGEYTQILTEKDKIAPSAITAVGNQNWTGNFIFHEGDIRKLTPKECWRLMGFSDDDFEKAEKVNSNSQLYKQAGNSIVVNVLMSIFNEMR